jgi:hypothetical protein
LHSVHSVLFGTPIFTPLIKLKSGDEPHPVNQSVKFTRCP